MNLRPHKRDEPDINLTPLIDVVFLLLIFFMVSTTFKEDARLQLQLPQAQGEPVPAESIELVEVAVDADGSFYVEGRQVTASDVKTLKQALVGAVGTRRDLPVVIKADAATPHQAVMTVLDAASQLGLVRVAFAATRNDAGR